MQPTPYLPRLALLIKPLCLPSGYIARTRRDHGAEFQALTVVALDLVEEEIHQLDARCFASGELGH